MKGDFSRLTFDPNRAFTQVLRQQGRVDVDADWNEQQAIHSHLDRTTRRDVIGPSGAPLDNAGFAIGTAGGLRIGAGRFYVGGQLLELASDVLFADQPYLAGLTPYLNINGGPIAAPTSGRYVFYLEAWDFHTTAVETPALRELALGGPDTTTRLQSVWRVRALRIGVAGGQAHCETLTPGWSAVIDAPTGTLAARARAVPPVDNLCALPESAGYQSLDHRLYRVEVHDPGAPGVATFKWSRDNAAFVTRWLARNGNELTVATTGFDAHIGFRNGGWVELTSDTRELAGLPGTLVRVARVVGDVLEIEPATATGSLAIADFGDTPKVRAWDGAGAASLTAGGFLALENGVEVEFGAGAYATGDYWTIPARSGFGVEWPEVGGVPEPQLRHGTAHRFARLALLDFQNNAWSFIADCRPLFPAATELLSLDTLSGDAQEIAPDPAAPAAFLQLRRALVVGVARGQHPVANAQVRFRIVLGNGQLAGGGAEQVVTTAADGTASIGFALDSTTLDQAVEATLLSPGGNPQHLTHTFNAHLSRAAEVSFDPANCPPLAGDRTVQAAIERLCQVGAQGCATYVLSPDADWRAVLNSLQAGENAHICFQRGNYETAERITLNGLGHILLTGCGQASRIVARGRECALHFVDCASLTVSHLALEAPDASDPQAPVPDINGVLTATGCGSVDIEGVTMLTGASARPDRACLAVRQVTRGRANTVTERVVVRNSHFAVGEGQTGVLVTDAGVVQIEDNRVTGAGTVGTGTGPGGFSPGALTAIRRRLVDDLIRETPAPPPTPDGFVGITVGEFTANLPSSVDQGDWERAVRANPPTEAELADTDTVQRYVTRIGNEIAAERIPAPSLTRLVNIIGRTSDTRPEPRVAQRLVLSDRPQVSARAPTQTSSGRSVTVAAGSNQVSFNSDISQGNWNLLMRTVGTSNVSSIETLEQAVREAANAIIADPALRARLAFARNYYDALAARTAAIAAKGIVCAGNRLAEVTVSGNSIARAYEGIRVALSHSAPRDAPPDIVGSVSVTGNRIGLGLPLSATRGDQGILIGNADRVHVSENEVLFQPQANDPPYVTGIELWGFYGLKIHLRENMVSNAEYAIRVTQEGAVPGNDTGSTFGPMWRAVANFSLNGGRQAFVFQSDPEAAGGPQPLPFIQQDNMRSSA